jgi:hypothetical protein
MFADKPRTGDPAMVSTTEVDRENCPLYCGYFSALISTNYNTSLSAFVTVGELCMNEMIEKRNLGQKTSLTWVAQG